MKQTNIYVIIQPIEQEYVHFLFKLETYIFLTINICKVIK